MNILYDLQLSEREVSFMRIKKEMYDKYPDNFQTHLILNFYGLVKDSLFLPIRNNLIHRYDPLSPTYKLETINIINELSVDVPIKIMSQVKNVRNLLFEVDKIYKKVTKFTEKTLSNFLCEITLRFKNEQKEYSLTEQNASILI